MGFGDNPLKIAAYMFAGLSMMLNIRLVYSAAPYALLRFKLPENLFSVFVRIMAGSLELWCLPSMTIGNIMDYVRKAHPDGTSMRKSINKSFEYQSIFWSWANFATFVILFIVFIPGDQGHLTEFYWVIAASGFVFGIYMVMVYALEFQYLAWYMVGENSFPMVTSLMHYVGTLIFGNRRKYNSDYIIVYIDIIISLGISLAAAVLWTMVYKSVQEEYPPKDPKQRSCIRLSMQPSISGTNPEITYTLQQDFSPHPPMSERPGSCGFQKHADYYAHLLSPALMVLVGMGLVYSIYPGIAPGMIVPFYLIDKIEMVLLIATAVPPVLIAILKQTNNDYNPYVLYGNWGWHHRKSCKSDSADGAAPNNDGECQDCGNCNAQSLKLQDTLTLSGGAGAAVTLTGTGGNAGSFTANASITITGTDFTEIDSDVTISITQGTIKNAAGDLQITSSPNANTVLALDASGTLGGGTAVNLKGTIKVTSDGQQKLGETLTITGGPNSGVTGTLNLANGNGNVSITASTSSLKINSTSLRTLKGVKGTINIGTSNPDTPVKYNLVTKDTIILGLSTLNDLTANSKVILKLPSLPAINIAPNIGTGISAESTFLTEVTFTKDDANFGGLKDGNGLDLSLNQSFSGATITKPGEGGVPQPLNKGDTLDTGTQLNIEGTNGGTTIKITNIRVTSADKSLDSGGSTTYTLSGGITGTLNNLNPGGKQVTCTLTITNISYDQYEIHDKHKSTLCCYYGKVYKWSDTEKYYGWHSPLILAPLQICLAAIFIYSLHYRDSAIARSIINQPKMSTALSIIFYMCHEILLAAGFPGIAPDDNVLLPIQLIGAYLMVLLAYYSVGYITEYKKHDPSQWPTEGMTKWNAMCYWLKMASKITNKNFKQLFTNDLNIYLVIFIKKYFIYV